MLGKVMYKLQNDFEFSQRKITSCDPFKARMPEKYYSEDDKQ